jgi:hypothetical protein
MITRGDVRVREGRELCGKWGPCGGWRVMGGVRSRQQYGRCVEGGVLAGELAESQNAGGLWYSILRKLLDGVSFAG